MAERTFLWHLRRVLILMASRRVRLGVLRLVDGLRLWPGLASVNVTMAMFATF